VKESDRIASLDILRGLAVFGILLINITSFALVTAASTNPFYKGELSTLDFAAWRFNNTFVEGSAVSVFGILFGAGIILSTQKKDRTRQPIAGHFYGRYGILAGLGILHAYFLWFGDILLPYALAAFVVFLMRKFPPRRLFIIGASLYLIGVATYSLLCSFEIPSLGNLNWPSPEEISKEISTNNGPWLDWFLENALMSLGMHFLSIPLGFGAFCAGLMMMMGMSLQKTGFFEGLWQSKSYLILTGLGITLGLLMTSTPAQVRLTTNYDLPYLLVLLNQFSPILMALGYSAFLIFLLRKPVLARLLSIFAPAGKMALTLYLMQSVICGLVFRGYGLGKFETLGPASLWLFCLILYVFQVVLAHFWLKKYRYGPVEWLWRRLSYGRLK